MKITFRNIIFWFFISLIFILLFHSFKFNSDSNKYIKITYSQFINKLQNGEIKDLTIDKKFIIGKTIENENFLTYSPTELNLYVIEKDWIRKFNINVIAKPPEQKNLFLHIFINWFPILLFIGVWIFFMQQISSGGGRNALMFGKSKARLLPDDKIKVTFNDVAGIEEAKNEVTEIVEFLREPDKFRSIGGKIPRGILLVGQPGTGKTLLAKAIAGEAKVPFFAMSGSDFVEMFVGVGASRVRDMFSQAKKYAPCIVFIDEIDAVGRHRSGGFGGSHDEREQTLNQLLVEMDGFEENEGIIIIAATNRPDVLDKALLRPGRFDRQVLINLPDLTGREKILNVHIKKIPISKNVETRIIARGTPGFSGADLANLVNEAALFSAKENRCLVDMKQFEKAKDKILMGVELKSLLITDLERKITAYHEAGHAIVGLNVPDHDPVYKISIIPRSRSLGVTFFLPEVESYSQSKTQLESKLSSLFGGRIAEEIVFGKDKVTIGASDDIKRATEICRNMVMKWGMSEKLGLFVSNMETSQQVFNIFSEDSRSIKISEKTANLIDEEIKYLIDKTYKKAAFIIVNNIEKLHKLAMALLKYETINIDQINKILKDN